MSEQFEHKVHELLGDIEFEPGSAVWQKVQQQIQPEKKRRRFIFWWLLPVVLAGGALTYYFMDDKADKSIAKADQPVSLANISDPITGVQQQDPSSSRISQEETEADGDVSTVMIKTPSRQASANSNQQNITPIKKQSDRTAPIKSSSTVVEVSKDGGSKGGSTAEKSDTETTDAVEKKSNTIVGTTQIQDPSQKQSTSTAKEQPKDTVVAVAAPIKNELKPKKWRLGITADAGIANIAAVQNNNYSPVFNSGSSVSGPPITSGSFNQLKQKQHTDAGAQFGAGMIIQRRINASLDLSAAFGYRYQSFAVRDIIYKDSANLQVVNYSSTSSYRMHQLHLSLGANYYFINKRKNQFGVTASIDNMYVVAANTNVATINSGVASFHKSHATGINKWQPHLRAGLVGSFTTNQNRVVQLSPYLRYGLRSFAEQRTANQHVWQVGFNINYYFR
jgi:hypothetical protein